jgi:hypothetical protein
MKLKSFGCSFISGADLRDISNTQEFVHVSQLTYPALLAKKLGYEYECHAKVAAGNLQIFQSIIDQVEEPSATLYIINWSWIDRFSYINDSSKHHQNRLGWKTIMPADSNNVSDFYYRNLHSELTDKLSSLVLIKSAIDRLKEKNKPFIMSMIDDLIFDQRWNVTTGILKMQDYIRKYIIDFEGFNFLEWSRKKGFPISQNWHPLEAAHEAAANLIFTDTKNRLELFRE